MAGTDTTEETKKSLYQAVRKWGGKTEPSFIGRIFFNSFTLSIYLFLFQLFPVKSNQIGREPIATDTPCNAHFRAAYATLSTPPHDIRPRFAIHIVYKPERIRER
jgi:hypothetical protein